MNQVVLTLCLLVVNLFDAANSLESAGQTRSWPRLTTNVGQNVPSILINIEEKLRHLENIAYSISRWDLHWETLNRRMEAMEVRISATQTSMQMELDRVSQMMKSCEMKGEIHTDRIMRKYETHQDRLNHRVQSLETSMETAVNKLQGSLENKIDAMKDKYGDMDTKVGDIKTMVELLKDQHQNYEEKINSTHTSLLHTVQKAHTSVATHKQIDTITNMLQGIQKHVNRSAIMWDQNDSPKITEKEQERVVKILKNEIDTEAQKIVNKVNNMYNELWKRFDMTDSMLKDISVSNHTSSRKIQEDLKDLIQDHRDLDNQGRYVEIAIETFGESIQRKFSDIQRKMENEFQKFGKKQERVLDTCHAFKADDFELEEMLANVLQKIIEKLENGSVALDNHKIDMMGIVKSYNSQFTKANHQLVQMIEILAENIQGDHVDIEEKFEKLAEILSIGKKVLQKEADRISHNITHQNKCIKGIETKIDILLENNQQWDKLVKSNEDNYTLNEGGGNRDYTYMPSNRTDDSSKLLANLHNLLNNSFQRSNSERNSVPQLKEPQEELKEGDVKEGDDDDYPSYEDSES